MKKLLALVLALVMTLGLATVANAADFADQTEVDASKYSTAIQVLTGMDVFKGYAEDNTFRPDAKITRAQVAAMIYRIYTGDVDDDQIKNYVNLGNFSDVKSTDWYAGYVGYCANAKFIKGYGDGTFQPNREISGYEALAMILRAVGYNAQNDFEGADYWVKVAEVAEQYKMLDNIAADDLTGKAPRATIAQILFDAINVPTVNWLPALGYQNRTAANISAGAAGVDNPTLGWKNFRLDHDTTSATMVDDWGNPYTVWFKSALAVTAVPSHKVADSTGKTYLKVEDEPVKEYTDVVLECDMAKDLSLTKNTTFDKLWVNGDSTNTTFLGNDKILQPTNTASAIGGRGKSVKVYKDTVNGDWSVVVVDTYLASVQNVSEVKYDRNNHISQNASITFNYAIGNAGAQTTNWTLAANRVVANTMTKTSNYEYAKGDVILVNIHAVSPTTKSVIIGKAESFTGAQTTIWTNRNIHTVNGTNYNDACQFEFDQAGQEITNHIWYLDTYGNIIGVGDVVDASAYGVIKNIQWVNPTGSAGYAQATLVLMDGKEITRAVTHINGVALVYDVNAGANKAGGLVSTTLQDNYLAFCAAAVSDLYQINTSAEGVVQLAEVGALNAGATNWTAGGSFTVANHTEIGDATQGAVVKTGVSLITGHGNIGGVLATYNAYTNANTVYLVQTIPAAGIAAATYTVVTGYNNIANYNALGTNNPVYVDYVDLDGDGYANYVYITGTPDNALTRGLFYLSDVTYSYDNVNRVWTLGTDVAPVAETDPNVSYVDGTVGTLKVSNAAWTTAGNGFTNGTTVPTALTANTLYVVNYRDGIATAVTPVFTTGSPINGAFAAYAAGTARAIAFTNNVAVNAMNTLAAEARTLTDANYANYSVIEIQGAAGDKIVGTAYQDAADATTGTRQDYNISGAQVVAGAWPTDGDMSNYTTYLVYRTNNNERIVVSAYVIDNGVVPAAPTAVTAAITTGTAAPAQNATVVLTATATMPAATVTAPLGTLTWTWSDGTNTWVHTSTAAAGANTDTLTVPTSTTGAKTYTCTVTNRANTPSGNRVSAPVTSNAITITVAAGTVLNWLPIDANNPIATPAFTTADGVEAAAAYTTNANTPEYTSNVTTLLTGMGATNITYTVGTGWSYTLGGTNYANVAIAPHQVWKVTVDGTLAAYRDNTNMYATNNLTTDIKATGVVMNGYAANGGQGWTVAVRNAGTGVLAPATWGNTYAGGDFKTQGKGDAVIETGMIQVTATDVALTNFGTVTYNGANTAPAAIKAGTTLTVVWAHTGAKVTANNKDISLVMKTGANTVATEYADAKFSMVMATGNGRAANYSLIDTATAAGVGNAAGTTGASVAHVSGTGYTTLVTLSADNYNIINGDQVVLTIPTTTASNKTIDLTAATSFTLTEG